MIIPAYIKKVMNILADAGYQVCIVGGAVRDSLRGVDINDYDLTTDAVPEVTVSLMEGAGYKVIDNNSFKFGIVVAIDTDNGNEKIEITTFRSDLGYGDARHPDEVSFTGSIEKDAARRDFTVNALYMDVDGNIKDPTGLGEGDVKAGLIRAVGDPGEPHQERRADHGGGHAVVYDRGHAVPRLLPEAGPGAVLLAAVHHHRQPDQPAAVPQPRLHGV